MFAFDPWCSDKPSWTEPVEALVSICCGPPSWLLPQICGEAQGGKDRWLHTHLYGCVRVYLCVCVNVHSDMCKCIDFCASSLLGDDITAYSVKNEKC